MNYLEQKKWVDMIQETQNKYKQRVKHFATQNDNDESKDNKCNIDRTNSINKYGNTFNFHNNNILTDYHKLLLNHSTRYNDDDDFSINNKLEISTTKNDPEESFNDHNDTNQDRYKNLDNSYHHHHQPYQEHHSLLAANNFYPFKRSSSPGNVEIFAMRRICEENQTMSGDKIIETYINSEGPKDLEGETNFRNGKNLEDEKNSEENDEDERNKNVEKVIHLGGNLIRQHLMDNVSGHHSGDDDGYYNSDNGGDNGDKSCDESKNIICSQFVDSSNNNSSNYNNCNANNNIIEATNATFVKDE